MEMDLRATTLGAKPIGRTPLINHRLREGNWVVTLSKPGYADLVYPVRVRRGEVNRLECTLLRKEDIGDHYLYVPEGPCVVGGDPSCPSATERRRIDVGGFMMARYPVTCSEYLAFLRALDNEILIKLSAVCRACMPEGDSYGNGMHKDYSNCRLEIIEGSDGPTTFRWWG